MQLKKRLLLRRVRDLAPLGFVGCSAVDQERRSDQCRLHQPLSQQVKDRVTSGTVDVMDSGIVSRCSQKYVDYGSQTFHGSKIWFP